MTSALAVILSWSRRHRPLVAVTTVALLIASGIGIRRLTFDTDVLALLPRDGRVIPAFRSFLGHFGSLDQLYILFSAPAGQSIADYDDEIDAWVAALKSAPEIARVDTGRPDASRDFGWLAERQLLLFPDDALQTALTRFGERGMREALAERRALLTVPSPEIAQLVRQDPLGLFDLLRLQLGGDQAGPGLSHTGYVSSDASRRLVIAQPTRPPYDAQFSRFLAARLDAIRVSMAAATPPAEQGEDVRPPLRVEFAGGHRIATETETLIRRESISNTVGSLALILPLLFLVFRSFWLVAVGSLPSIVSLLLVLGALGFAGATLSAAATASAAMLFGLGVDGVVLLYVAYTRAVGEGLTPEAAIEGLAGPSYSMLLGMWTTAATFYGLVFVDFPSLEQLGQLIGHSMVICALVTLVLVPATLPRTRARRAPSVALPWLATWVQRRRMAILIAATAVTVVLAAAATGLRMDPTLDRLKSTTPSAMLQEQIAPMFGLPGEVYVIIDQGPDLETLLVSAERVAGEIGRTRPDVRIRPATSLLPSQTAQARRADILQRSGLDAREVGRTLARAAEQEGFRTDSFDPFRTRLPAMLNGTERLTFDGFAAHGLGDLLERFVVKAGGGWLVASYVYPSTAMQVEAIEAAISAAGSSGTLTGLPLVNRELGDRFLPQFTRGLGIGTFVVIVIVVAAFRNWWLSLLALLPTGVGLVWAAGLLALAGIELDLFALFAVVTFVGIGVDYGIHLVQRYRERGDAGAAVAELAPVILVAAGITVLGYGTLVTSSYAPLRSIGLVSAISVAALAVASVLVLPALLTRRT